MRKLRNLAVCAVCAGVLLLLFGCLDFLDPDNGGGSKYGYYGEDESYQVIIGFNGNKVTPELLAKIAPQESESSRALTYGQAFYYQNNYEVVFSAEDPAATGTYFISRAQWSGTASPTIDNVYTNGAVGADYSTAGKAVLFAGDGDILLGVGKLKEAYDASGTSVPLTAINHTVVAVKFEVAALTSELAITVADSSLKSVKSADGTLDAANTVIRSISQGGIDWPIYLIDNKTESFFQFEFDTVAGTTAADFFPGIMVKDGGSVNCTPPRYGETKINVVDSATVTGSIYKGVTSGAGDNFAAAGEVFNGKIILGFEPVVVDKIGACSVYFKLPVFAISAAAGKGTPSKNWYITNGISNSSLDNGTRGEGGAIMLGVGSPSTWGIGMDWFDQAATTPRITVVAGAGTLGGVAPSYTLSIPNSASTFTLTATLPSGTSDTIDWELDATSVIKFTPHFATTHPAQIDGAPISFTISAASGNATVTVKDTSTGLIITTIAVTVTP